MLFLCAMLSMGGDSGRIAEAIHLANEAAQPRDYPACLKAVKAGKAVSLAVGVTDRADYATQALPGVTPGVYDCWRDADGTPKMRRREQPQPLLPRLFNPPLVPVIGGG